MKNKKITSFLLPVLVLIFTSSTTAQSWVEKAKSAPSTQGNYQQYGTCFPYFFLVRKQIFR